MFGDAFQSIYLLPSGRGDNAAVHVGNRVYILLSPLMGALAMSHLSGKFFQVSVPTPHVYLIKANRAPVNAFDERYGMHVAWCSAFYRHFVPDVLSVWREYSEVFRKVSLEDDVRVVVLASGLDKLFTAGLDRKFAS